jgi:peptide/nickel transport system ATP-binding protein/oligopeptide transport system ATP-binding protein
VAFKFPDYTAEAVRGVSFDLPDQSTLGIVGESGCGKTMTALSLMRLIPEPYGKITAGSIHFENQDILTLKASVLRSIRGRRISMIFQDPMTSLNPLFTCGAQISEILEEHKILPKDKIADKIKSLLEEVGITDPQRTITSYPHQMSGGMRQRVMIAMALACSPRLLIADEPTTALDVTVQAKILDLLHHLRETKQMSMMLISHNLGIVADIAEQVMVMYGGEIMEFAPVKRLFENPLHPYTQSLLKTLPTLEQKQQKLAVIPGDVPTLRNIPDGCPFNPRCKHATSRCKNEHPGLYSLETSHTVRCFLYDN